MVASLLPQEMIDAIIGHLHWDDKPSFKACSLVCKAWTHPSRLRLFTRATLKWPLQPALFPFVRHLCIPMLLPIPGGPPTWNEVAPLLIDFRRIESLNIFLSDLVDNNPRMWSTLGNKLSNVGSLFLHLWCVRAPAVARILCAFPCLRELYVSGQILPLPMDPEAQSTTTLRLSPHLHKLCLDVIGINTILEWFLSLPVRPALRTVSLEKDQEGGLAIMSRFIEALGHDLETLTLSLRTEYVDITPLTRLRSIHFVLQQGKDHNRWITHILSHISSEQLEYVAFHLDFLYGGEFSTEMLDSLEWDRVDAALQCPTLSSLRRVNVLSGGPLSYRCGNSHPIRSSMARAVFIQRLPKCYGRGILRFD